MTTKEEAIKIFQDKIKTMEDRAICCNYGIDKDAFIFAIQAIQAFQTPCDDAISRQAVLAQINCWISSGEYEYTNATYYLRKRINSLSPVTSQQKIGHWTFYDENSDLFEATYKCSCCKRAISIPYELIDDVYKDYPYCHCGARMIDPQEEVQE